MTKRHLQQVCQSTAHIGLQIDSFVPSLDGKQLEARRRSTYPSQKSRFVHSVHNCTKTATRFGLRDSSEACLFNQLSLLPKQSPEVHPAGPYTHALAALSLTHSQCAFQNSVGSSRETEDIIHFQPEKGDNSPHTKNWSWHFHLHCKVQWKLRQTWAWRKVMVKMSSS